MVKKLGIQAALCLFIFVFFAFTGEISVGNISKYSEAALSYITEDYDFSQIRDEAVSVMSSAVQKPEELYRILKDSRGAKAMISPVDELSASAISKDAQNEKYTYCSEESIIVYSSGRGMVESIAKGEDENSFIVSIRHDEDVISKYIGCTRVYVKEKESVNQGQIIAEVNDEGRNYLELEIWEKGEKRNPGEYIDD